MLKTETMIESIDELAGTVKDFTGTVKETLLPDNDNANIAQSERILSLASGSFVFLKGIGNMFSHPTLALGELIVGGVLVYRGVTGICPVKQMSVPQTMESQDTILIARTEF